MNVSSYLDPRFKTLAHLPDEAKEKCAGEVKRLMLEIMCSNDGEITEIGSNSDEDSSPPTSKWEKSHPLQELLGKFQLNSSSPCATTTVSNEDVILFELTRYNTEKPALLTDNPLTWWKEKLASFPNLSLLARKYLGIVATSVPSERLFSVAGLVVNNKRASLQPINVEKLVFLHHNSSY